MTGSAASNESPCIAVCVLDGVTGLCTGCGRSIAEISRWGSMSTAERAQVLADLAARRPRPDEGR